MKENLIRPEDPPDNIPNLNVCGEEKSLTQI